MTPDDIAEMFIRAAEAEAKMPEVKGLREDYGRYALPWVHDRKDITGRGKQMHDHLKPGDDPLNEWRYGWLDEWAKNPSKRDVSNWEGCIRITTDFLTNPKERRALWAWAMAQAKTLYRPGTRKRMSFARWCRDVEKIAEETGRRRKKRAIDAIFVKVCGKHDLHDETPANGMLPFGPENRQYQPMIEGGRAVYDTQPAYSWRDDPSFNQTSGLTLAEWRAHKRRQREARRRKQEAA